MPGLRGWAKCSQCGYNTAVTLYIQKRIDDARRFVPFGKFCGFCAQTIQMEKEAKRCVDEVFKNKYRFVPKIKGKGAPI